MNHIQSRLSVDRATIRNIRQNLFFAFDYSAAGIPIAAGALYLFTSMLLSPNIAAAAMSFYISVVTNVLRLNRVVGVGNPAVVIA